MRMTRNIMMLPMKKVLKEDLQMMTMNMRWTGLNLIHQNQTEVRKTLHSLKASWLVFSVIFPSDNKKLSQNQHKLQLLLVNLLKKLRLEKQLRRKMMDNFN